MGFLLSACKSIGLVETPKALLCFSAAIMSFVSFVLAVLRADEIEAFFKMHFRGPF